MSPLTPSSQAAEPAPLRLDERSATLLDPDRLLDHLDALYRAACALSGARDDAEDLVQETFAQVLKRPRFIRRGRERAYLLRALRHIYYEAHRTACRRPATVTLRDDTSSPAAEARFDARQIMEAVASALPIYRDAVIAVDVMGMSYKEAARALHTREGTITTRLYRGRRHVVEVLTARDEVG